MCTPSRRGRAEYLVVAVLIPSGVKLPMVAGCLSSSASLHASYWVRQTRIYPDLNKTEMFLKLLGLFLQEKLDPEPPESALSLIPSWMLDQINSSLCTSVSLQMRDNDSCPSSWGQGGALMHLPRASMGWLEWVLLGTSWAPLLLQIWSSHPVCAYPGWVIHVSSVVSSFLPRQCSCPWLVVNSPCTILFRACPGGTCRLWLRVCRRCSCSFHSAVFFPSSITSCFTTTRWRW